MAGPGSLPLNALIGVGLASAGPDPLRAMVKTFAHSLMSAEAGSWCDVVYGKVSEGRVN